MLPARGLRRWPAAAVVTAAVALSLALAAPASAGADTQNLPFAATIPNPCSAGETAVVHGHVHITLRVMHDRAGGFHVLSQERTTGSGVGAPSGDRYHFLEREHTSANSIPRGAQTLTLQIDEELVRQGKDARVLDDMTVFLHIHVTVNANGVPTAHVVRVVEAACR